MTGISTEKTIRFVKTVRLIVAIAAFVLSASVQASDDISEDFFTWAGFEMTTGMPAAHPALQNFRFKLFMQGRFGDDSSRFSQGLIRTGAGYVFNEKMAAWLGYDWVPTSRPLALRRPFNDHALWQQLSLQERFSFGTLISRTRFEQHFFDIPGSSDTAQLFRQMFKFTAPLPQSLNPLSTKLSLIVWNEIFANMNSTDAGTRSGFNQNRAFAGIGYPISKAKLLEIGYMNQYINRPHNPRPDQMLHVFSVTLLMNF